MSPEQAAGAVDELTIASDIFSLGAILYAILTGRPPYRGAMRSRPCMRREPVAWRRRATQSRGAAGLECDLPQSAGSSAG